MPGLVVRDRCRNGRERVEFGVLYSVLDPIRPFLNAVRVPNDRFAQLIVVVRRDGVGEPGSVVMDRFDDQLEHPRGRRWARGNGRVVRNGLPELDDSVESLAGLPAALNS